MSYNILSLILEAKKKKLGVLKKNKEGIVSLLKKAPKIRSFKEAIRQENKVCIIAELKQASPSAGLIRKDFSCVDLATKLQKAGADALSIITEEEFFLGKGSYIEEVRSHVNIPLLRKDFIIDEIQVLESRVLGADAILLIMRILDEHRLQHLCRVAHDVGMEVLVEVHTEKELRKVLKLSVDMIGVNNRNLNTLKVDMGRAKMLIPFIPKHITTICESGVKSMKDMLVMKGLGVDAVLVGEAIMGDSDIEKKLKELKIDN
jgi:indole-3-glycerol phosphate synthase